MAAAHYHFTSASQVRFMKTEKVLEQINKSDYGVIGTAILFALMHCGHAFTEKDFIAEARKFEMPPAEMSRLWSLLCQQFEQAGYIRFNGKANEPVTY